MRSNTEPKALLRRFAEAINAHDLDAIVSCFAPDYHDVEPAHPKRQIVGGAEVVRKNWGTVLRSVTDFRTEVRTIAAEGDVGLIEHDWSVRDLMGPACISVG
jgi:ketosteroid isomerase-like protein